MTKRSVEVSVAARLSALRMAHEAQASHIGSSLSVIDLLSVIYVESRRTGDAVIVSKGHAAAGTYAVLGQIGDLPFESLSSYGQNGSTLGGHVTHSGNPSVRLSTGSLGHGMPYGLGIALAMKKNNLDHRVFVVMSDGECDEGTTWESALLANQFELDNLVIVIDRNKLQSLAGTEETLQLEPFAEKWKSFGWDVRNVDGHNHDEILPALKKTKKPLVVIAHTIKGKGVSFMEDSVLWHYRPPTSEDLERAFSEINSRH